MDKLSIFNLLTSLLEFYGKKNSTSVSQSKDADSQKTTSDSKTLNGLDSLLSSLNLHAPDSTQDLKKKETPAVKNQVTYMPIQKELLSTITSHDKFVKRVLDKNKKQ